MFGVGGLWRCWCWVCFMVGMMVFCVFCCIILVIWLIMCGCVVMFELLVVVQVCWWWVRNVVVRLRLVQSRKQSRVMNRKIFVGWIIIWLFIWVVMKDSLLMLIMQVREVFLISDIYWLRKDGSIIGSVCGRIIRCNICYGCSLSVWVVVYCLVGRLWMLVYIEWVRQVLLISDSVQIMVVSVGMLIWKMIGSRKQVQKISISIGIVWKKLSSVISSRCGLLGSIVRVMLRIRLSIVEVSLESDVSSRVSVVLLSGLFGQVLSSRQDRLFEMIEKFILGIFLVVVVGLL